MGRPVKDGCRWSFSVKELSHDGTQPVMSFPAQDQLTVAPVTFHVDGG